MWAVRSATAGSAPLAAGVHRHHDHHPPVRGLGHALDLDHPVPPSGRDVLEVLADAVVPQIRAAADAEHRVELDLGVAELDGGLEVAARHRIRKEPRGGLALGWHATILACRERIGQPTGRRAPAHALGSMFWLSWKTFVGSYSVLMSTSRS